MASNVSLRAFRNGYDINYLSLGKAYNYTIQLEYLDCKCYYCSLNYLIRKALLDRGKSIEYLSVAVTGLERFEEMVPFYLYPYYEEY